MQNKNEKCLEKCFRFFFAVAQYMYVGSGESNESRNFKMKLQNVTKVTGRFQIIFPIKRRNLT